MVKRIGVIFSIAQNGIKKRLTNPRIYLIAVLLIAYFHSRISPLYLFCEHYGTKISPYESEQKELLEKVKEEEKQLSEMEQKSVDMRLLLQGLREFTDMNELTPTIVNKLIRRIEVHNPEKKHARKSVKIDIYFTAVGLVSLPDEQEIRKMMEQIRSTSQIPKQLTA